MSTCKKQSLGDKRKTIYAKFMTSSNAAVVLRRVSSVRLQHLQSPGDCSELSATLAPALALILQIFSEGSCCSLHASSIPQPPSTKPEKVDM